MTGEPRRPIVEYIRELTWSRTLRVAFTLISFVGILSPFFKVTVLTIYLLGVGAFSLILIIAYMSLGRTRQRTRSKRDQEMIEKYTAEIAGRATSFWTILRANKVLTISANGDCTEFWTIQGKAVGKDLSFYRLRTGPGQGQPVRQRRKIRATARTAIINEVGGLPHHVTTSWREGNVLEVLAHFSSPVLAGNLFTLVIEVTWPEKCRPLVKDRESERFSICFANPVKRIDYTVTLPPEAVPHYEPIGFTMLEKGFKLTSKPNATGRREVVLRAMNVDANHAVGMSLKLQ